MTGRPVKAEYGYTGGLWGGPNSPGAISVLAIPALVTCVMRSAGRRGKTTLRSGAACGRPGDAVGCQPARCFPVHLRTSAFKSCRRAGQRAQHTGCSAAWLARLLWEQEAAGSNPAIPTRSRH